jgi:peptidyl-prolyl cis-trans isomerase D
MKPGESDQGIVATDTLPKEVQAATEPGIVGPVETPLGPALYRVNAIMAAKTTPFEEAKAKLAEDRALEEAKKRIADDTAHIEDLIAGGATLEEIASETELELGKIDLNSETRGGLADDPKFRDAAAKAETGVETDLVELSDGGLLTLRVDKVDPPAVIPLAEIRDRVAADWTADQTADALQKLATGYIAELKGGLAFADLAKRLNRPVTPVAPLTRGETAPGLPPGIVADVFAAAPDAAVTRRDGDGVVLAQLTQVEPFDPKADANARVLANLGSQYREQVRDDTLALYTAAVRDEAGVTVNQSLLDTTLERFP